MNRSFFAGRVTPEAICAGFAVLSILLAAAVFIGVPRERLLTPTRIDLEQGHAFITPLEVSWPLLLPSDDSEAPEASNLEFSEDGKPLGPAHTLHDVIRSIGAGGYSHWKGRLRFSTSDNSDPRANSRQYTVSYRLYAAPVVFYCALGGFAAAAAFVVFRHLRAAAALLGSVIAFFRQLGRIVTAIIAYPFRSGFSETFAVPLLLLLLALSVVASIWQAAYYVPRDLEMTNTKHYYNWGWRWEYGGYGNRLEDRGDFYELVHLEAFSNQENARHFLDNGFIRYVRGAAGGAAFDRLATPFLSSLLARASFGGLDSRQAFVALNALFWITALLLAANISWRLWRSRAGALGTVLVLAAYSVFPMMLTSVKVQYAGALYLLTGIGLFLAFRDRNPPIWLRLLAYSSFLFLGFFASGGILQFGLFLGAWLLTHLDKATLKEVGIVAPALLVALLGLNLTDQVYDFTFASESYHAGEILKETGEYLGAVLTGADPSDLRFLNIPPERFWKKVVPGYIHAILWMNPFLFAAAGLAAWVVRGGWKLVFVSFCLLGVHAGTFLTGWTYYYGYNTTPAILLLSVLVGAGLARMLASRRWALQLPALLLSAGIIGFYAQDVVTGKRYQVMRYYGSPDSMGSTTPYRYPNPIYVYHDEHVTRY